MKVPSRAHWSLPHTVPMIRARYGVAYYLTTTTTAATPTTETPHAPQSVAVAQGHRMSLHTRCDMVTTLPRQWTWAASYHGTEHHTTTYQRKHWLTSSVSAGSLPRDRSRSPPIHSASGDRSVAEPHIQCTWRHRSIGRAHEVHVRSCPAMHVPLTQQVE